MSLDVEWVLALIVASLSFISGCVVLIIFIKKNIKLNESDDSFTTKETSHHRSTAKVSARLPSLILIEIILLIWFLMGCAPLMILMWCYLPTQQPRTDNLYDILGSIIFVVSFIPIYTTHIIRIWLLKLKYNITSLSMLNQLGMIKWKEIRQTIWTKIYYNYKWSHNVKALLIISTVFTTTTTIIYSIMLIIDIRHRVYLNVSIFGTLTLFLIIGIFSLKSFNDPFSIFREEVFIIK